MEEELDKLLSQFWFFFKGTRFCDQQLFESSLFRIWVYSRVFIAA